MDTSQNSSLLQVTQTFTAISVCSSDNCLSADRRWRRPNSLCRFAVSLKWVSPCPLAGSTNVLMRLLHKLILWTPAQISCCVSC